MGFSNKDLERYSNVFTALTQDIQEFIAFSQIMHVSVFIKLQDLNRDLVGLGFATCFWGIRGHGASTPKGPGDGERRVAISTKEFP